jgi:hypothetical protein
MSETTEEIVISENYAPEIHYQNSKAEIDIQISTAKNYPRSIKRATDNAIAIVTIDQETAMTCNYSIPRGGKKISGPTVHLAKILAQTWGNMRVDAKVVSIDDAHITSESVAFDLETNLAIKVQVKRRITYKDGRRFDDDMITVTGNAANSIAFRNAVLSVVPKAIVDKVYNAAKQVITGDISDVNKMIKKRKVILDGLKETYGVTEKEALSAIGKVAIDHITPDDIVTLVGIGQAIKDGDTTVEQAFRSVQTKEVKTTEETELDRGKKMITNWKTISDAEKGEKSVLSSFPELFDMVELRKAELRNA